MVVEGIAVDAAVLHDVFHSDLAQGPLVELLQKGLLNGPAGKIRHGTPPADWKICNT